MTFLIGIISVVEQPSVKVAWQIVFGNKLIFFAYEMNKVVSAEQAVALIEDGDILATSGFVGMCKLFNCFKESGTGTPDELLVALEKRFLSTNSPR